MPDVLDPTALRLWLEGLGPSAWPVFLALQVLQVLVFWIPGDLVQIAGGMVFGWWIGTVLSLVGVTIGSQLVFGLARRWGRPRTERWLAERGWATGKLLQHPRLDVLLGVAFLLPLVPKDALSYLAGLSRVGAFRFFWVTSLARIPSLALTCWIGTVALEGQLAPLGFLLLAGALVAVASVFLRQRLARWLSA